MGHLIVEHATSRHVTSSGIFRKDFQFFHCILFFAGGQLSYATLCKIVTKYENNRFRNVNMNI